MLILAIDTTSEHGGVALYGDHERLADVLNTGTTAYSISLFQMADQVLELAGTKASGKSLTLRDVELYAVANGPGSFTGIRTGLAAVQGWATALAKPVVGVSVLAAMIQVARPETERAMAVLDARRSEFYVGAFKRDPAAGPGGFQQEGEGMVMSLDAVGKFMGEQLSSGGALTGVLRENDAPSQALRQTAPGAVIWKSIPSFLAGAIAHLGLQAYRNGKAQTPAELDALYIRRSDAELNWRS